MAIVVQKLEDDVFILEDTKPAGEQVLYVISPTSVAKPIHRDPNPDTVQFLTEQGKSTASVTLDGTLKVYDFGGSPTLWVGTTDAFVDKMNNEYLVPSVTSDPNTTIIADKITVIVDGVSTTPTGAGLQTYTPAVANEAELIDSTDADRTEFIFQVKNGDCYLRFSDATTNPASRTEKTVFLSDGQTFSANYSPNGSIYQGALSVINTEDGGTFDFVFLKFNK